MRRSKNNLRLLISVLVLLLVTLSCSKNKDDVEVVVPVEMDVEEEIPIVRTLEITDVTTSGATIVGNVSYQGTSAVINHGLCWGTNPEPTLANDHTEEGPLSGNFSTTLESLNGAEVYFVRSYATNSEGTGYGEILSFRTLGAAPQAFTGVVDDNFPPNATINGFVIPNLLSTSVYFEYSITDDFQNSQTSEITSVTENGGVTHLMDNLSPGQTYYYRFIAENDTGISIGETRSFISQFSIGDYYKSAWILQVDQTGLHGLLCKIETTWFWSIPVLDQVWGPPGLAGAFETALYTGGLNSQKILDLMSPSEYDDYVVGRIHNYVLEGNDQWYMASKDELALVRNNIYLNGFGDGTFGGGLYWSSSEIDIDYAWSQNFESGAQIIGFKQNLLFPNAVGISEF